MGGSVQTPHGELQCSDSSRRIREPRGSMKYFAVLNIVDKALPVVWTRFNDQPEALPFGPITFLCAHVLTVSSEPKVIASQSWLEPLQVLISANSVMDRVLGCLPIWRLTLRCTRRIDARWQTPNQRVGDCTSTWTPSAAPRESREKA